MRTLLLLFLVFASCAQKQIISYDIIIYGGTPAGISAAIQAARMNKKVLLIEPTHQIGGMSTNGLGMVDVGHDLAIGGIAREFHKRIFQYYQQDSAWQYEGKDEYKPVEQDVSNLSKGIMWTFEPHVAEHVFIEMLNEAGVKVIFNERIDLENGVQMNKNRIAAISMESGTTYKAKMFIDAGYEGDLMALAGVDYTVGRESNDTYKEMHNGIQPGVRHNNLPRGLDPYIGKGKPESGILPGIFKSGPGIKGEGDEKLQAYNYRLCFTNVDKNRLPFEKPETYDSLDYELLLRMYENGYGRIPWRKSPMPNCKTDVNNSGGFSTDFIGQNYNYPEAGYEEREKIAEAHLEYIKGLFWTLANNPRVPGKIRKQVSEWGPAKDEFTKNGGWPYQMYVREARRMIGEHVMTEHHCTGNKKVKHPVGLGSYPMDSHSTQRYISKQGDVQNEGNIHVNVPEPYSIEYLSLVPREKECANLLVPVCLSASHVAFASIRMEPVWMVLGQSAGAAACLAIDQDVNIQDVGYKSLEKQLKQDGQILTWDYEVIPASVFKRPEGGSGLKAEYFSDDSLNNLVFTRVDTIIDFYFHESAPDERLPKDYFSIRWTGKLTPDQSGEYWIATNTDDGTRLWINDSLLIDDWNQHGAKYNVAKIQLQKGKAYDFKMEYMDLIGKGQASLQWRLN
ncbi:MAG: FAD-dependent oxidoreductase [Bacteroidota bacterium]